MNVFESLGGLQRGSAGGENDVLCKRWAVFDADAEVFADSVVNRRLEEKEFQRLGAFEAEKVEIGKAAKFWRKLEVCPGIRQKNPWVDEIGLTFFLAGAKRRNKTARSRKENTGAEQANTLTIPETKEAAGEIGKIDYVIKSTRAPVAGIAVARSVQRGNPLATPIFLIGNFSVTHLH